MTKKLYYQEPSGAVAAVVLDCRRCESGFEVLLDQTPFYPEGGGQLSDVGELNGARVSYVFEDGEVVWHRVDKEFSPGQEVRAEVDAAVRLDYTQQHTGEHIVSGLAFELFGAKNVGFHMAPDYISIDLDLPISEEQAKQLEDAANAAIARDIPVMTQVVDAGRLDSIPLRKEAQGLTGEIRVVTLDGVDCCACCGTHCKSSALVRLVKITSVEKHKAGARLFVFCGERAIADYQRKHASVQRLARRFSTSAAEVENAVLKQGEELAEQKRLLGARTARLFGYIAGELLEKAPVAGGVKLVSLLQPGWSQNERSQLAQALCADASCLAMLFVPEGDHIFYSFARGDKVKLSMKDVCAAANAAFSGKGGGRDAFAQGSGTLKSGLSEAVEQFERYILTMLR